MRLHRHIHELPGLDELLPPVNDKSRSKSLSPFRLFDFKTPPRERDGHQTGARDASLNEYPLPIDLLTVLTDQEAPEPRTPYAVLEAAPQGGAGETAEKPFLTKEAGTSPGRTSTLPRPRSLRRGSRRSVSRKPRSRRCSASLRGLLRRASGEREAAEASEAGEDVGVTPYMPMLAADAMASSGHPSRPGGGSWDWPLSRIDQKARLLMIDREMLLLEREEFLEQLASAQAEAAPVAGSASGASRRSSGASRARSRRSPKESPLLGGQQGSPTKSTTQHSRAAVGIGGG